MNAELPYLAKYPFSRQAKAYIRERKVEIEEIVSVEPPENYALQDAWNRVFGAFVGKIAFVPRRMDRLWMLMEDIYRGAEVQPTDVLKAAEDAKETYANSSSFSVPSTEEDLFYRIISYPLARIVVSCVGDRRFVRRYALKEGELLRRTLQSDFENGERYSFLKEIGKEFGLNIDIDEESASMDAISYVKNTAQMKDRRKKLLFQDVSEGMVFFRRKEGEAKREYMEVIFRSFQQALQVRIEEELPLRIPTSLCDMLSVPVKLLSFIINDYYENYSLDDLGKVEVEKFPPCMKRLLSMSQSGINLPHSGRFALTAFLHKVGMSVDDIVKIFSASPDFDEGITRYQVRHISGELTGVEYTPQKCSVLMSEGLCYHPDELCKKDWMVHPLIYYKVKKEGKKRDKAGKNRSIRR